MTGIAILRYRLWDIDIIIQRTLIYSILSGLLVSIYFLLVVIFQSVFVSGNGEQPAIITVISTLLIAALFNPLRTRVQDFIDRRFYRRKYDAEQALTRFAASTRDEVDVNRISAALLTVVEETVQPEKISLLLKH